MNLYLSIPLLFLKFWFFDAPHRLIRYFLSVNHAVLQITSLPLMLRTFFKPVKNEYRKGLVWFSIGMGMFLKSILIFMGLAVLLSVVLFEVVFLGVFILWPLLTIYLLFI